MQYNLKRDYWISKELLRSFSLFMLPLNRTGSIVFLAVITLDWLFKVAHLHHQLNKISILCAIKIAVMVWITDVLLNLHVIAMKLFIMTNLVKNYTPNQ